MDVVADRDLHRVLDVLDTVEHAPVVAGQLPHELLASLADLVPCDAVAYADLDAASCTHHTHQEYDGATAAVLQDVETETDGAFWQHYQDSLMCSYPTRTGDHRTVTLRSDFYSAREWQRTPMYVDCMAEYGFLQELLCPLSGKGPRSRRLIFFRRGHQEFVERDRDVLTLLRPHLAEALARSSATTGSIDLTPRQRELMQLVAAGRSNAEIAALLYVSPHTVRKHLENVFARLGVNSRTAAVARVFG